MSPALVRLLLHTVHLATFAVLLATGVLLLLPDLRALMTGGYSLLIRETHRWSGVALVALPLAIAGRWGLTPIAGARAEWTARAVWQAAHLGITSLFSAAFAATGFVLWAKRLLPESLVAAALEWHDWLTYIATGLVGVHVIEVGVASVVARMQSPASAAPGSTP